jgi:hypothetical protein
MPWEASDSSLVTLCDSCHARVTELRRRASKALGDFNLYELPVVVEMLERLISENDHGGTTVLHLLAELESERENIIADSWSKSASRRLEDLDAETDRIWERLQG